uniref:Uncharacterized protein n=1 Tax=Salix viminalis TaxID=40686 RepID=A0A6N2LFI1_SALVM
MLDERAKNSKIFADYHKRLHQYVDQARDAQRSRIDIFLEERSSFSANSEKEAVYSTVKKVHVQQFLALKMHSIKMQKQGLVSEALKHCIEQVLCFSSQNMGSLRQFELEVWAKEREAAGLRTSLDTLMSEIQRLNQLCAERKEAEESLRKNWKKIEEFDARRSEL